MAADKAERERQNARRRELRKEKAAQKAHREEQLIEIGKGILSGIRDMFKEPTMGTNLLVSLLGAGAAWPYKLELVGPTCLDGSEMPRNANGTTAEWFCKVKFNSMSTKMLNETSMSLILFSLQFGGGIKSMSDTFDLIWTGPDLAAIDKAQWDSVRAQQRAYARTLAITYLMAGGAMAGFMGYNSLRILGGILGGMLKQDLIPTP